MRRILWLIDPLSKLKRDFDSSLFMMSRAESFGVENYYAESVILVDSRPIAKCAKIQITYDHFNSLSPCKIVEQDKEYMDLNHFDLVMNRKEPPVDEAYLTQCRLLMLHQNVLNSPLSLQSYNEKLLPLYLNVGAPTSVGLSVAPRDGVAKPLNLFGGTGVKKVSKDEPLNGLLFQNFLPEVTQGEIRYLTLGGEVLGELLRVPKAGEFRANTYHGATVSLQGINRERSHHAQEIAKVLSQDLGIQFAAIDYIGKKVSEINITCPALYYFYYVHASKEQKEKFDELFKNILNQGKQG